MNGDRWNSLYPGRLLAHYVSVARRRPPGALPKTAMRTPSLPARRLLAYATAGESASLEQLLTAARTEDAARKHRGWDPAALADLGRVIARQDLLPQDRSDALAIFELALELFGGDGIPPPHQGLHAQLAYCLGNHARAAELLSTYTQVSEIVRSTLELDLTNPFLTGDDEHSTEWLRRFEALLPECRLALSNESDRSPFDRLTAGGQRKVAAPDRISVIVASFKPDSGLLTAVRSLLDQTWANIEVLIVNDGSPEPYDSVFRQCLLLDHRIRLVTLPANAGTYVARNAGLNAASGRFVTFLDSDDWSHPRRLEQQIAPLLADTSLIATTSKRLTVTDRLVLTHLHRPPRGTYRPSLMFRKDPVLARLGYFDRTRKAGDTEYERRLEAAFGERAIRSLSHSVHTLYRQSSKSLTAGDFRSAWVHPARAAYWSAYALWHRSIRAGTTSPYLPKEPTNRPFPSPAYVVDPASEGATERTYDVVYAGDWRPAGGLARSLRAEVNALTRHGLRVGVMHFEAYSFMSDHHERLCPLVQELINEGIVDHVLPTEGHHVSLLVFRYPPVLQFPPHRRSRLQVGRAVILAGEAPSGGDGSDMRYVPAACTNAAEELFSTRPVWAPEGFEIRASLEASGVRPAEISDVDVPAPVGPEEDRLDRTGFRSNLPVVGCHSHDCWRNWPFDGRTLLEVYPDRTDVDVRIMGGSDQVRTLLEGHPLPGNWLVYDEDEVSVKSFLFQLDFWVYFPHPGTSRAVCREIIEALDAGCVVILPWRFSDVLGDAALYSRPREVQTLIQDYYSDPEGFLQQSRRAQARVRQRFSPEGYFDVLTTLRTTVTASASGASVNPIDGTGRGGSPIPIS